MNECVNCHKALRDDFKVCPYCGTRVDHTQKLRCEKCHAEITEKYAFCPRCGSPVNKQEKPKTVEKTTPVALSAEFRVAYCYDVDSSLQLVEGALCISNDGVRFKDLIGTSHDHLVDANTIREAHFTSNFRCVPRGHCYVLTLKSGEQYCYCFTCFQNQKLYEAHLALMASLNLSV